MNLIMSEARLGTTKMWQCSSVLIYSPESGDIWDFYYFDHADKISFVGKYKNWTMSDVKRLKAERGDIWTVQPPGSERYNYLLRKLAADLL